MYPVPKSRQFFSSASQVYQQKNRKDGLSEKSTRNFCDMSYSKTALQKYQGTTEGFGGGGVIK